MRQICIGVGDSILQGWNWQFSAYGGVLPRLHKGCHGPTLQSMCENPSDPHVSGRLPDEQVLW